VKTYEASVIFKPILDLDTSEGGILSTFEAAIESFGGEVLRTEKVGRKRLAYEINKFKDGYIVNMLLSLPPQNIVGLRKHCSINEDVLRITLLNMSEAAIKISSETNTTVASQNIPQTRDGRFAGRRGGGEEGGNGGGRPGGAPGGYGGNQGGGGGRFQRGGQQQQHDGHAAAASSAE
jgi:small subunit ribosomal protein S6